MVSQFSILPERANYFDDVKDLIYDSKAAEPSLDWKHIVLENIDRLPFDFLVEHKPSNFLLQNVAELNTEARENYWRDLSAAIEADDKRYRAITNRFKDSVKLAIKRVNWNYKTAIPTYFPRKNKISLLLPLALTDDEVIDLALVVERTASGNYIGNNIYPLDWAYTHARLITRPDSDWLSAELISEINTGAVESVE